MHKDLNSIINENVQIAIDIADQNFGIKLDGTESSISKVEQILEILHQSIPKSFFAKIFKKGPTEDELSYMTAAFGAYFGKVFTDNIGGNWSFESKAFPGQEIVTLHVNSGEFWPMMKVRKRIENGSEDNVYHYYQVLSKKYGPNAS